MAETVTPYPATLSIDYPDKPRNRLTCFFRAFTVVPIYIVLLLLMGAATGWRAEGSSWYCGFYGFVVLPALLMILFRQKYPKWWFDWNLNLTKFAYRVAAYFLLLRDEYPSTDEEQAVHIDIAYPDVKKDLKRWLPLFKWIMAIPHYIVLVFIGIGAAAVTVIAWFTILFTGRYPKGMFDFVVNYEGWCLR
ncbi:MAG: DUF4389 domain-containing protein, partial [Dehalococcoidia bacterium]|nr:DUF4389 domain-containing protein [Dehalococcoidia bacterium]